MIIDDGFVLWESNVDHALPRGEGRPRSHSGRRTRSSARSCEQWLQWQATELNPQWGYAVYALLRKAPGFDDPAKVEQSLSKWGAKMKMLEERLEETGAYAGGATFSLADIALGLSLHRWYAIPAELPEFPAIRRYYDSLKARPAGARYMAAGLF